MPGRSSPSSPNRRGAAEQRLDEQQAPAVADAIERGLERADGTGGGPVSGIAGKGSGEVGGCHRGESVVDCKSLVIRRRTHRRDRHREHPHERHRRPQAAITTVAERVGPSIVGIGRGGRGSGVVVGDGVVLTNAHNLRGDEVTVTFADGRRDSRHGRGVDGDGDLAVVDGRYGRRHAARVGATARPEHRRPRSSAPRRRTAAARGSRSGFVSRGRARVPRSGRPPDRGQRRAHRAARAGLVRRRARRRRGPTGRPQHEPHRRGLLPRAAGRRGPADRGSTRSPAASPRRASALGVAIAPAHVARRLRRSVGLPDRDGVLVRGVEEGSAAAYAGIEAGDLIVEAGEGDRGRRRPVGRARRRERPYEVVVRGADEKTLKVTAPTPKPERTPGDA